jgi:S-adenosylmethionine decarboxylase
MAPKPSSQIYSRSPSLMVKMGQHCLLSVYGCSSETLENVSFMLNVLEQAAEECGATILSRSHHKFSPQGLTAILLLSESHISVHTYPEHNCAAFDIFTCGKADSKLGVRCILSLINSSHHTLIEISR